PPDDVRWFDRVPHSSTLRRDPWSARSSLIALTVRSLGRRSVLEDLVRLAVDPLLVGLRKVPLLHLLRRPRLGIPGVRRVRHRVLALLGKPELRLLDRVALRFG